MSNNQKIKYFLYLIGVFVFSLLMNWLVQLAYYFYSTGRNPQAFFGQKTLLDYYTGVVGDVVIVPFLNILIMLVFWRLNFWLSWQLLIKILPLGLFTDFLANFLQGWLNLTNWSMPKPFVWNFAGYWHMISLPIQMTYLYLFFYTVVTSRRKVKINPALKKPVLAVFGLMLLFVVLFLFDNGWI